MGSKRFTLNMNDVWKLLKGMVIAALGAILTYLMQWATSTDFGEFTPAIVAVVSVLVNVIRKWLMDYSDPEEKPKLAA